MGWKVVSGLSVHYCIVVYVTLTEFIPNREHNKVCAIDTEIILLRNKPH